jgi:hypothetical protein
MCNDESLFASGFELDKPSRRTTYTQQELYDYNPFHAKYNVGDLSNQTKNNASSHLKKPLHTNTSERDDMSSNFNINLMNINQGEDFNNISGVLNDVNASMLSYNNNNNKRNNDNIEICKETETYEINNPRKSGQKFNQMAIDLSKNDGKNMELLNHINITSPVLNNTTNHNRVDSAKLSTNLKTVDKKEETKTEKFFFSFEKENQANEKQSKNNSKKFSSKEVSTEMLTDRNKFDNNIGSPIITVTKKIPKTFNKKDINLIEEILNTQNEFQTNEDIEINHTSFNNNITYVRSFPFGNSNQYNSMILINSGNDNENDKTSPHNKTTTAFSKTSDIPFLENQMHKEYNRIKESAKMREIIQSFSDEDHKILQIEDTKEYSEGPCDTCAKQCVIF